MTKRQIVIVNDDEKGVRYAIPFENETAARKQVGLIVLETAEEIMNDETQMEPITVRSFPNDGFIIEGPRWIRIFIQEEGREGVYLGFDSGERDNFSDKLPVSAEFGGNECYGDSDAYLFHTVGKRNGVRVEVSEVK